MRLRHAAVSVGWFPSQREAHHLKVCSKKTKKECERRLQTKNTTSSRPGRVQLGKLGLGLGIVMFFHGWHFSKEYFGVLFGPPLSIVVSATRHVASCYGKTGKTR